MENRFFTLVLVVALGVLIGVGVVMKQTRDPVFKTLVEQQARILKSQNVIENRLSSTSPTMDGGNKQALEQRVAALESQVKALQGFLQGQKPQVQAAPADDNTKVYDIEVGSTPIFGKKDAPVTIVEFVDFQCPFCTRFHGPMTEAVKAYPDKVNYMLKNFPLSFHPMAKPAAKAAFAAGEQGKYYEMVDAILSDNHDLSEDKFQQLAKKLGLNVDKFMKDLKGKDAEWEARIKADMDLGSRVDVGGTPTFFINGRKTNARNVETYKREIDEILKSKGQ